MSWRNFLIQQARDKNLSPEQAEVFLLRFDEQLDYDTIVDRVGIPSKDACLKRMGEVYFKFDLTEGRKGKENRLRNLLEEQYQQSQGVRGGTSERYIEPPGSPLAANSPFYIERPPYEALCSQEILKEGALIQIKGPQKMGKTSLKNKILSYAKEKDYTIVELNLSQVKKDSRTDIEKFFHWFCTIIGKKLEIDSQQTENDWDDFLGGSYNCEICFEKHFLPKIQEGLILVLDEVDELFEHLQADVEEFLTSLRAFHEKSKSHEIWKKLRIIVVYSTEEYLYLDINQSPLANVGLTVELSEFTEQQIQKLAQQHGLDWDNKQSRELVNIVGGHPYLVRLALYEIATKNIPLENIQKTAATDEGIYRNYLQDLLDKLDKDKEKTDLVQALQKIIDAEKAISLNQREKFKLYSLGLVKLEDNNVKISCKLYRDYFSKHLRLNNDKES